MSGLEEAGVCLAPSCPRPAAACPNSVVLSCPATGSRTIVHTNLGLPELSLQNLAQLDLTLYSWVHLEGRNKVPLCAK